MASQASTQLPGTPARRSSPTEAASPVRVARGGSRDAASRRTLRITTAAVRDGSNSAETTIHSSPGPVAASPAPVPETPRAFRVYDDSLPASSQPQTPQNLPEARHRSRLHGSYTVPARHSASYPARTPTTIQPRYRSRRLRNLSPPGLQTPGFMGLYGGIENSDESVLFEQASREIEQGGGSQSRTPASP